MRITLPNVWLFAKLLNGFGSHCSRYLVFKLASPVRYGIRLNYMYLYSPILFDSQDLNHNLSSTHTSAPAGDAASPYTILPKTIGLCQWNGGYQLSFPGSCRCSMYPLYYNGRLASINGMEWSSSCHAWCAAYQDP